MRNFILFISFFILFGCTTQVEYIPIPQRPIPSDLMNDKENAMIVITNQYRASLGLPKIKTSLSLYYIAKQRNYDMIASDTLSHYGFNDAYLQSGALYFGESLSRGYESAEANIEAFHNSVNHWQMFTSPIYDYMAVSCEGNWTTVLFGRWRPYDN